MSKSKSKLFEEQKDRYTAENTKVRNQSRASNLVVYLHEYFNIIKNRRLNPLSDKMMGEWHHIVPRSLGGTDNIDNLIFVSYKEHYILHLLLWQHFDQKLNFDWVQKNPKLKEKVLSAERKMFLAFAKMRNGSGKQGELRKKAFDENMFEQIKEKRKMELTGGIDYQQLLQMSVYYRENNCGKDPVNWETFRQIYGWTKSRKSFTKLCNQNGIIIKNKIYSDDEIKDMVFAFIEKDCANNPNHFIEFQNKYNYDKNIKDFYALCNRRNIFIQSFFEKPIQSIYDFGSISEFEYLIMLQYWNENKCPFNNLSFENFQQKFKFHLSKQEFIDWVTYKTAQKLKEETQKQSVAQAKVQLDIQNNKTTNIDTNTTQPSIAQQTTVIQPDTQTTNDNNIDKQSVDQSNAKNRVIVKQSLDKSSHTQTTSTSTNKSVTNPSPTQGLTQTSAGAAASVNNVKKSKKKKAVKNKGNKGFVLSKNTPRELIEEMFNDYLKWCCWESEEKFALFRQKYNYFNKRSSLVRLFNHFGFIVSNKIYSDDDVAEFYNWFTENRHKYGNTVSQMKQMFADFQATFNYTGNKNNLIAIFQRRSKKLGITYDVSFLYEKNYVSDVNDTNVNSSVGAGVGVAVADNTNNEVQENNGVSTAETQNASEAETENQLILNNENGETLIKIEKIATPENMNNHGKHLIQIKNTNLNKPNVFRYNLEECSIEITTNAKPSWQNYDKIKTKVEISLF